HSESLKLLPAQDLDRQIACLLAGAIKARQNSRFHKPRIHRDCVLSAQTLDDQVVVWRKNPKRFDLSGKTDNALEITQAHRYVGFVFDMAMVQQEIDHLHEPRIETMIILPETRGAAKLHLKMSKHALIVHPGSLENCSKVLDNFVGMSASLQPPSVVESSQLVRREPCAEFRGQIPDKWHHEFEGSACTEKKAGYHLKANVYSRILTRRRFDNVDHITTEHNRGSGRRRHVRG